MLLRNKENNSVITIPCVPEFIKEKKMRTIRGKKHNPYKKLFEDAIKKKRSNVTIQRSYRAQQRNLIINAINIIIQRPDIQNIHNVGNGNFIIEYELGIT